MAGTVGLDFETYGAESLRKHGLYRYINHPSFTPLIGSLECKDWSSGQITSYEFDFVDDRVTAVRDLEDLIGTSRIVAHNAQFEQATLNQLGLVYPCNRFIDSVVISLVSGAGPMLEAAAPQLLDVGKMDQGKNLINLFTVPGKYQEANGNDRFDRQVIEDHPAEWSMFKDYCSLDAQLGLRIYDEYAHRLTPWELEFAAITMAMNRKGWPIDITMVEEMQRRYRENLEIAEHEFRVRNGNTDLNLNSLKQLKEWCGDRGIRAFSFDKTHVDSLLKRIRTKLDSGSVTPAQSRDYSEVVDMLETKKTLGGSSLKKLQVMLDYSMRTDSGEHRLRDQYQHCGAGQTLRTTGRNVQMQNLMRLGETPDDMEELDDVQIDWDNDKLAANLRQVFIASEPDGQLIVGDFKSVEARGLAWLAGEKWKLDAYAQDLDIYKELASRIYDISYDKVTKTQRQTGKTGELSCGYGAGGGAVRDFAEKIGVTMSEGEAAKLVYDWRDTNPAIVEFWSVLDSLLHATVETDGIMIYSLPDGMRICIDLVAVPDSLVKQVTPLKVKSLRVSVYDARGNPFLMRYFHGCYTRGRNVCYFKPSSRKTGDLWRAWYMDPKTKQRRYYELYGGKLAGILTQSFCRELFMHVLVEVNQWCQGNPQLKLIGQFHDEIVVDRCPGGYSRDSTVLKLRELMSDPFVAKSFPLAADVKFDYRYTK